MVFSCAVPKCTSRWLKHCATRFHAIPSDPELRQKWICAMNLSQCDPKRLNTRCICSKHFLATDYDVSPADLKPRIKHGAIPSIVNSTQGFESTTVKRCDDFDHNYSHSSKSCKYDETVEITDVAIHDVEEIVANFVYDEATAVNPNYTSTCQDDENNQIVPSMVDVNTSNNDLFS